MEERHLRRVVVEVDQPIRGLADDDRAIGADDVSRELQDREALGHGEVLEHGIQQEDVDLATSGGHRAEDLGQRMELELDVVDASGAKLLPSERDPVGVDVDADHLLRALGKRAADGRIPAAVFEHRLARERDRLLDPRDQVLRGPAAAVLPAVRILAGLQCWRRSAPAPERSRPGLRSSTATCRERVAAGDALGRRSPSVAPSSCRLELADPRLGEPAALLQQRELCLPVGQPRQGRCRRGVGLAQAAPAPAWRSPAAAP